MRDERLLFGFLLFQVLVAAPGMAILYALGLVRLRAASLLLAAGPAFLVGVVAVGVPLIALLAAGATVGTGVTLLVLVLVAVVFGAAGAVLARRRGRPDPIEARGGPAPDVERWVERALLGVIALYFVVGSLAFTHVPTMFDDANIWSLRALGLYFHDSLSPELLRDPDLTYVHLDYPILQPLLESSFFRALGGIDLRLWHAELWFVLGAAIWTLAWLLGPLGRRWPWVVVIGVLAASPLLVTNVTLGDADTMMAALLGCAALAFGIWVERGLLSHAVLGALFLVGSLSTKNEGLAFSVGVLVALLAAVATGRLWRRWRHLLLVFGIVVAGALPWLLWVAANPAAQRPTPGPFAFIFGDWVLAKDRFHLLGRGIDQIALQLTTTPTWGLLVPCFLATAVFFAATRRYRPVAVFYLVAALLATAAVAYTYWATPIFDLAGFERRTGPRIVLGVVFVAGVGLAHFLQLSFARDRSLQLDVDESASREGDQQGTAHVSGAA